MKNAEPLSPEDLEEDIRHALINADIWPGGGIGWCSDQGKAELRSRGLIGPRYGLTHKGVAAARKAYNEYWSGT